MSGKLHKKIRQMSRRNCRNQWDNFIDILEGMSSRERFDFAWRLAFAKNARAVAIACIGWGLIQVAIIARTLYGAPW